MFVCFNLTNYACACIGLNEVESTLATALWQYDNYSHLKVDHTQCEYNIYSGQRVTAVANRVMHTNTLQGPFH